MKIYAAGGISCKKIAERYGEKTGQYPRLDSYFYVKQNALNEQRELWSDFFLDSGAYSAFTRGIEISADEYAGFVKRNASAITHASTLDDVRDWKKTRETTKYLESLGVTVLPCFHYSEPWHVLEEMAAQYSYVAIGGMVPVSTKDLEQWLPEVFKRICNADGTARVKAHGFGLTTRSLVVRFPWESVDSTSAVMQAATGGLLTPHGHGIEVGQSGSPTELDKQYIASRGWDLGELSREYLARQAFNIESQNILQKQLTESPPVFEFKQTQLL